MELFEQHDVDGHAPCPLTFLLFPTFFYIMSKHVFEAVLDFVADINEQKDCLMSQDNTQDDPGTLWFNIDIPKGHSFKAGDRVRVTVEKVE